MSDNLQEKIELIKSLLKDREEIDQKLAEVLGVTEKEELVPIKIRKWKKTRKPREQKEGDPSTGKRRVFTDEERANILQLHSLGDGPSKIAKMFNVKPQAISNFLVREKHKLK